MNPNASDSGYVISISAVDEERYTPHHFDLLRGLTFYCFRIIRD
jgi:hypothetical protein